MVKNLLRQVITELFLRQLLYLVLSSTSDVIPVYPIYQVIP